MLYYIRLSPRKDETGVNDELSLCRAQVVAVVVGNDKTRHGQQRIARVRALTTVVPIIPVRGTGKFPYNSMRM